MSDSILVRVTLDSYDMASTGRQTQVYVQIPEVARVSWLLPEDRFQGLVDRAWPEVLDVTHDYVTYGGAASNSSTTAAWKSVMEWLRDDANRDEMQAAWEQDQARRHPVARKLLKETERLSADLEQCARGLRDVASQRDALLALVQEIDKAAYGDAKVRLLHPVEQVRHLRGAFEAQQSRAESLDRLLREAQARVVELEATRREFPLFYLADYEGAGLTLHLTREAARDACDDIAKVDAHGQGWDWRAEDGVDFQFWTDPDNDRPTGDTGGAVWEIRVEDGSGPRTYPPALPWAKHMDADDLESFLADLVDAASGDDDLQTLAAVEDAIGRWRVIGEAQHAHNTAPGPDAEAGEPS